MTDRQLNLSAITQWCRRTFRGRVSMGSARIINTVVRRWHRLDHPAPGWIAALVCAALLAAAGAGEAVTLNPGDFLIAQSQGGNILRINPLGGQATVLVSGDRIVAPVGIAIAANGDLLVADLLSGVIRVNPADLSQTPVSSGGHFTVLTGIAIAATGELFVTDQRCCGGQGGVIRVNPVDGTQTVVSPVATQPNKFVAPTGIAIAATGDLFVSAGACCGGNGGVIRVNPVDGTQTVVSPVAGQQNK
jgi:sugar lactone lactonase YvrE